MDSQAPDAQGEVAHRLVASIHAGDTAAESELVTRFSRGLRFLLRRKAGNSSQVEDLLQETWAIALRKLRSDGLEDPGRLAGYLCGIASNLALAEHRREYRQKTAADSDRVARAADEAPSAFQKISRAEVCTHVRSLLNELRVDRDREILNRFYVLEEDKQQICEDLGVDATHFNRVLFRARQRLKDLVVRSELRANLSVVR